MIQRIGFACKWIDNVQQINGIKPKDSAAQYNTKTTTITWLNKRSKEEAEHKLISIAQHNLLSTLKLVEKVSELPPQLRMLRLSSDILPAYSHTSWGYYWQQPHVVKFVEKRFKQIGDYARSHDVRLSFHPGQFCCLSSQSSDIVANSIKEFEYHADMIRWMGYGQKFQDFKCNVHISGRQGPAGIRKIYNQLSPEARNTITVENEENTHGLDACLELSDIIPIVLDSHHYWCREGEYIQPDDPRMQRVIDSWRGVRPVMHYSQSQEIYLEGVHTSELPVMSALKAKKQKLRAHSSFYHNHALNNYIAQFLPIADIVAESKGKNLASFQLAQHLKQI